MNEFVEECRREWRRLQVPDPIANEMAADLEADLTEAEAEGVSPQEVLGSGAFDPRSFASSWAAERGVAQPKTVTANETAPRATPRRRLALLAVLVGSAVIGLVVLAGVGLVFGRVHASQGIVGPGMRSVAIPPFPRMRVGPLIVRSASFGPPIGVIGLLFLLVLLVGIAGLMLTVLVWRPWDNPRRWSRPSHDRDQTPQGHFS